MRFYGGLMKTLSVILMLANTVGWTIAAVVEVKDFGMSEYIFVFVLLWFAIMLVLLGMFGTGMGLSQVAKLKKRVAQLEKQGVPVQQYIPANPIPAEVKAFEVPQREEELPRMPEMSEKPEIAPAAEAPEKKAKGGKKWLFIAIAAVVVIAAVLVIVLVGGKDKAEPAVIAPAMNQEVTDMGEIPQQPDKNEEAAPEEEAIPVSIGGYIDNENFTMTFDSMALYDEYKFRTSEYSSTSLFVEDGYQVLVVEGHFTNNSTGTISDSAFNLKASVNDKYTAEGYDVRISFIRSNTFEIDAYTDVDYVLYVNVPDKIAAEFETATFTIGWKNDMSIPITVWDVDGNQTVELDNRYALTGGPGEATAAAAEEVEYNWIALGETVYTDSYEFTLKNVEMTYEVLPPNTGSVYSSYAAESGKVYVHVVADVKNIMQRDIRIDELFTAGAYYDWKYPYEGFTVVEDDNRFDWVGSYVAATPLETCGVHSIIECPVEVDTSGNSVVVNIQIGEETYYYTLR